MYIIKQNNGIVKKSFHYSELLIEKRPYQYNKESNFIFNGLYNNFYPNYYNEYKARYIKEWTLDINNVSKYISYKRRPCSIEIWDNGNSIYKWMYGIFSIKISYIEKYGIFINI